MFFFFETLETLEVGPDIVCQVAGVPRATFHSWISRQYLPLSAAPGMGRERKFSALDVIRISVVTELTRLGLSIGLAARAAKLIVSISPDGKSVDGGGARSSRSRYQVLALAPIDWKLDQPSPVEPPAMTLGWIDSWDKTRAFFEADVIAIVDLTKLVPRVLVKLKEASDEAASATSNARTQKES